MSKDTDKDLSVSAGGKGKVEMVSLARSTATLRLQAFKRLTILFPADVQEERASSVGAQECGKRRNDKPETHTSVMGRSTQF